MVDRTIATSTSLALSVFPAVLLTGARQTGKTTLARHLWPEAHYVGLDDPALSAAARLEPDSLLLSHPGPTIVDGLHYAPGLLPHLERLIDADRRPGRFLLVSLPTAVITSGAADHLAGRAAVFSLPPLSLGEALPAASREETAKFLWRSGFPELWENQGLDRDLWLGRYVASFLERDVRQAVNVDDLRAFDRFVRAAALRSGQLLSHTELARDSGISPNTARRWLAVLEASQLVFLLQPYPRSRKRRLIKAPKLYFADTGLLTFLMGFRRESDLSGHALWPAVWENFVVSEVRKHLMARANAPTMWFWRTAHGDNVELLLEAGAEQFSAIVCYPAENPTTAELKGVSRLAEEWGSAAVARARLACRTAQGYPLPGPLDARAVALAGPGGLLAELAE